MARVMRLRELMRLDAASLRWSEEPATCCGGLRPGRANEPPGVAVAPGSDQEAAR